MDKTGLISGEGQIRIAPEREREAYEHYRIEPPGTATGAPRLVVWEVEIRAETVRG